MILNDLELYITCFEQQILFFKLVGTILLLNHVVVSIRSTPLRAKYTWRTCNSPNIVNNRIIADDLKGTALSKFRSSTVFGQRTGNSYFVTNLRSVFLGLASCAVSLKYLTTFLGVSHPEGDVMILIAISGLDAGYITLDSVNRTIIIELIVSAYAQSSSCCSRAVGRLRKRLNLGEGLGSNSTPIIAGISGSHDSSSLRENDLLRVLRCSRTITLGVCSTIRCVIDVRFRSRACNRNDHALGECLIAGDNRSSNSRSLASESHFDFRKTSLRSEVRYRISRSADSYFSIQTTGFTSGSSKVDFFDGSLGCDRQCTMCIATERLICAISFTKSKGNAIFGCGYFTTCICCSLTSKISIRKNHFRSHHAACEKHGSQQRKDFSHVLMILS